MKRKLRILACILLAMVLVMTSFCGCGNEETDENEFKDKVEVTGYGLHISQSGWITLNGQPFYGFGVVWKDAFKMKLNNPSIDLEPYFQKLQEGAIPYVRVMMGFDDAETVVRYNGNKEEFYSVMDSFVALAEKYNIGIVANLFWDLEAVPKALGENLKKTALEKTSTSAQFMADYAKEIATRYKDSKALWAWEISDGGNLLCETKKIEIEYTDGSTYMSNFTTEMLKALYENVSNAIKAVDDYRMISNGDGSPRFFSKALRDNFQTAPWDSDEDLLESFTIYSAGSVDCLSVQTPYVSYLSKYKTCGQTLKKGLYVSAFCGTLYTNLDDSIKAEDDVYEANEQESFNAYVDGYIKYGVQMATAMNFASYAVNPTDDAGIEVGTTEGVTRNTYAWRRIVLENSNYIVSGKLNTAEYWK